MSLVGVALFSFWLINKINQVNLWTVFHDLYFCDYPYVHIVTFDWMLPLFVEATWVQEEYKKMVPTRTV